MNKIVNWPKKPHREQNDDINLNESKITLLNGEEYSLANTNIYTPTHCVFFRSIKKELLQLIAEADSVFGCIAWATDGDILEALSKKVECALVVNKEEFIDPTNAKCWLYLKNKMEILPKFKVPKNYYRWVEDGYCCEPDTPKEIPDKTRFVKISDLMHGEKQLHVYQKFSCRPVIPNIDLCLDKDGNIEFHLLTQSRLAGKMVDPIRCFGILPDDTGSIRHNTPRMHNKFFVFKKGNRLSVWTGSFNCSMNSSSSLENATLIRIDEVAMAYLREWQQIFAMSEDTIIDNN
jgi:hypothetical protein